MFTLFSKWMCFCQFDLFIIYVVYVYHSLDVIMSVVSIWVGVFLSIQVFFCHTLPFQKYFLYDVTKIHQLKTK